jgi:hypothetical protein
VLAVPADDLPAHTIAIAAEIGIRIDQKSNDGMNAKNLEETHCASAWPECTRTRWGMLVKGMQDFVLLLGSGVGEFLHAGESLLDPGL